MKIFIYLMFVLYFSSNSSIKAHRRYDCGQRAYKRIDGLTARLLTFGNSGREFPESKQEVPNYCNETKSLISTFDDINKRCLKGLPKQVLSVVIYSINTVMKQLCKKSSKRLETILSASKCANDGKNELDKCFAKTIDNLLGTQHADDKQKLPMACCQYDAMKACGIAIAPKIPSCTQAKVNTIIDFVDSIAGNALNLVCAQYLDPGSDLCSKLTIPKKKQNQIRSRSIFVPLVALFESFSEV